MTEESTHLTEMIKRHNTSLKRFALKLTHDEEDSNDLVQETLLCAWRFFHTFKKGTNELAWLRTIMKNQFINNYRKSSVLPIIIEHEQIPFTEQPASWMSLSGINSNLNDEVIQALMQIKPSYRLVFLMNVFLGYAYEEIALILHIPRGTVSSRIAVTNTTLRSILNNPNGTNKIRSFR